MPLRWTAWTDSKGLYGLSVPAADRDAHFKRSWASIELDLPDERILLNLPSDNDSFWREDRSILMSTGLGAWLLQHGFAPWKKSAPTFAVEVEEAGHIRVLAVTA